jgi:hypothetical protein
MENVPAGKSDDDNDDYQSQPVYAGNAAPSSAGSDNAIVPTDERRLDEIRAISQLCPSVFSSFAYSFFPMKAYTNPHKAILTVNDVTHCRS